MSKLFIMKNFVLITNFEFFTSSWLIRGDATVLSVPMSVCFCSDHF